MHKPAAVLLLGPTGAGKTPLGEILEQRGLWGRWCHHFDFGGQLRRVSAAERPTQFLAAEDVASIREALGTDTLLKDKQFHIAEKILRAFINRRRVGPEDLIVLNGLPRHAGQACDIAAIVEVGGVIELSCNARTVLERIGADTGGDRADRRDDDGESIRGKLETYSKQTAPLLDHYRARGARIETLEVRADTSAENLWNLLNPRLRIADHGHQHA